MKEFEEFEGLSGVPIEESSFVENEDDDPSFRPVNAATLTSNDIYYELEKRALKTTGFPDTDRDLLQRAFDEEFKADLEEMRARRREKQRKAAQQLGLQKRRMLMEKTLQDEQDELAKNHQVGMVIELIKENVVGTTLRVGVNSITARSLAKAMWINNTITCLDLSSNDLNDHAGTYLARILKRNSTLKKIELDNNRLGPKSCQAFGESLMTNTSVVYLSLDSNPIVTENDINGFKTLADSLRINRTLTSLNLWRTGITENAGKILASSIDENHTLLFCDIGHNGITVGDVKKITDKLHTNMANYEKNERGRRQQELEKDQERLKEQERQNNETKQKELSKWLQERRDQRGEDKRVAEQLRILRLQEEMEERKRLMDQLKEEERKAAEEAAAKKAKKKDKGKKK